MQTRVCIWVTCFGVRGVGVIEHGLGLIYHHEEQNIICVLALKGHAYIILEATFSHLLGT